MESVMRNFDRLFHDLHDWDGVGNWNGLLDSDGFRDFDDFRRHILLANHPTEIDKLLARLLQISVISIHCEVKLRLGSLLMDAINLALDMLLLLVIKVIELVLQLFGLLVEFLKVERLRRRRCVSVVLTKGLRPIIVLHLRSISEVRDGVMLLNMIL